MSVSCQEQTLAHYSSALLPVSGRVLGAHAYAIFFSTALKRTLRLPTSAVASATAPSSV